jgi:molybdate transport system substrate-binding protein
VTEGEVFDLVFNTSQGVERMAAASKLDKGARADFCRSAVGVAVRTGVPRADVSTVEGLKAALLNSQSIAISSGASGRYIEQLFVKLGVAEQVKQKTKQPPSGAQIGEMLARGEAELGFQQVSELIHASGIQYLGSLPVELQNYTVWSAGVHASAPQPSIANTFLKTLGDSKSALALRNAGLEPM